MSDNQSIIVPDLGGIDNAEVIEITVKVGDQINQEETIVVLESDKATVDVPCPYSGTVTEISINVGDKLTEGSVIGSINTTGTSASSEASTEADTPKVATTEAPKPALSSTAQIEIVIPDIGGSDEVEVIDVMIQEGDTVEAEQSLLTLESDKATMDVPSLQAGKIISLKVSTGDKVKEGSVIALMETVDSANSAPAKQESPVSKPQPAKPAPQSSAPAATNQVATQPKSGPSPSPTALSGDSVPHASPSVRKFARELGADIKQVAGTGSKGRITKDDVQAYIKAKLSGIQSGAQASSVVTSGNGIEPIPAIDFSQFGEIEDLKLSRIKKISGPHLTRSWLNIPHVTHHDEADITELEAFRKSIKDEALKQDVRITLLAFITQAVTKALMAFPSFNSSLSPDGASVILKKYYNVGIAVDTPHGLMVPNIKDCHKKSAYDIARDMGQISLDARDGKIKPDSLKGGTFSISSLGGIGGTAFTPIVNAPEVAILGITRSQMKPVWNGKEFEPRLMIPLDLSYDHRVIDGAEAARFMSYLCKLLSDPKRMML